MSPPLVPIQKLLRTPLTALGVLTAPRLLRSPITAIGVPRYVSGWGLERGPETTADLATFLDGDFIRP